MQEREADLIQDRRALHQIPELGASLPFTKDYLCKRLDQEGISWKAIGASGILVLLGSGKPVVLLRADMDGLPVKEESGLPFASKFPGKAHACGHDCHAAGLLHTAILLKEKEKELKGTVKLLFQPNEEGLFGALEMIENGCLTSPDVDVALAMHISASRPLNEVSFGDGPAFASSDTFDLLVRGNGCHAAMPERGKDVICASFFIAQLMQTMVSREFSSFFPRVLSITSVQTNSDSYNSLPSEIQMKGTVRSFSEEVRRQIIARMKEICSTGAELQHIETYLTIHEGIPAVNCDHLLSKQFQAYANELLLPQRRVFSDSFKRMGSEDFAYYGQHIPIAYFFLGVGIDENTPSPYGAHSSKMVVNEKALVFGPALMAHCAMRYLEEKRRAH